MANSLHVVCISVGILVIGVQCDDIVQPSKRQIPSTCTGGYEHITGSTMCLTDSPSYIEGSAGVSDADKTLILQLHNQIRADVNPTAAAMPQMYWDDELARVAEKWAKQCYFGHEETRQKSRQIPGYSLVGQNINNRADTSENPNWSGSIAHWDSEKHQYRYNDDSTGVGHYVQMISEGAMLVGCGYAKCSTQFNKFYVCNYLTPIYDAIIRQPYTSGDPCSGCPETCTDDGKLCACGGIVCFNGVLDVNTCQCRCDAGFQGDTCFIRSCPSADPSHCESRPLSYCSQDSADCPQMCAKCQTPVPDCGGKSCFNNGKLDKTTCLCSCTEDFVGDTCLTTSCDGKICQNDGVLDTRTCGCKCTASFKGTHCETSTYSCPPAGRVSCQYQVFDPQYNCIVDVCTIAI